MRALPLLSEISTAPSPAPRGRLLRYSLRVSVLEQCNLSCAYCMTGSITPPSAKARWLSAPFYLRLAQLFCSRGVVKVHLTGGEPLVRADIFDIVAAFKDAMPDADLALTTNALKLSRMIDDLARAGLRRATVHLDTLRADRYLALMGEGSPAAVLEAAARAQGVLGAVKMNVVVQMERNDDQLHDFLALSARTGIEARGIELMNTGSADAYYKEAFVAGRELLGAPGATPLPRRYASGPAALYRSRDVVVFGVIASDSEPFCVDCDRLSARGRRDRWFRDPVAAMDLVEVVVDAVSTKALHVLLSQAFNEAERDVGAARARLPSAPRAWSSSSLLHNARGSLALRSGDLQAAVVALEEAVRLEPDIAEHKALLASALLEQHRSAAVVVGEASLMRARVLLEEAMALRPRAAQVPASYALCLELLGDAHGSLHVLEQARARFGDAPRAAAPKGVGPARAWAQRRERGCARWLARRAPRLCRCRTSAAARVSPARAAAR